MYKLLDEKIVYVIDGLVKGEVLFKLDSGSMDIYHTYVSDDLRGKGIAHKLVDMAIDYGVKNGYKIKCSCSYARKVALKRKIME